MCAVSALAFSSVKILIRSDEVVANCGYLFFFYRV